MECGRGSVGGEAHLPALPVQPRRIGHCVADRFRANVPDRPQRHVCRGRRPVGVVIAWVGCRGTVPGLDLSVRERVVVD